MSSPSSPLKALENYISTLIPTPSNTTPANGSIPGAVVVAVSSSSTSSTPPAAYSHSTGTSSLDPTQSRPLTPSSLFWIASCTKLLTSLAACQLVHRGLWTWSRPITDVIPELRTCRILKGWSVDGEPVFETEEVEGGRRGRKGEGKVAADKITLPHLLTHTSGLAYDFLSPPLLKYQAWQAAAAAAAQSSSSSSSTSSPPAPKRGAILETYLLPLLSYPGTTWAYGPSIDFAGLLVERLTGMRLGAYIWENVLRPVGGRRGEVVWRVSELTDQPSEGGGLTDEEVAEKYVYLSMRHPDGKGGMVSVPGGVGSGLTDHAVDDLGGGGVRASPAAYVRVLESLVRGDGRILPKEVVERWGLRPWLVDEEEGEGKLGKTLGNELEKVFGTLEGARMLTGGLPLPVKGRGEDWDGGEWEYNHSLLGSLSRRRGSKDGWALHWGGLPNLFWFVDPQEEVAGLLAMQLLPPADPVCLDLAVEFREAVVKELGKSGRKHVEGEQGSVKAKI